MIIGWKLWDTDRVSLLERFPPRWPDVIADHVTLDGDAAKDTALPAQTFGLVIGHVDDGTGLEALVVSIDGTTARPDGSVYHITWSLDREQGRTAVESNDVLARMRWTAFIEPIPIVLIPAQLR